MEEGLIVVLKTIEFEQWTKQTKMHLLEISVMI